MEILALTTSTNKTKVEIEIGTSQEKLRDTLGEPSEVDFIEHYETYYIDGTQVYIYFDVDEEGTKAAAVTAIVMRASAMPSPDVKNVTLNRPFIYAIVDNSTKLPVFIGTVNDIKK